MLLLPRLIAGLSLLVLAAPLLVLPAAAQQRGPVQRVVQGRVLDQNDKVLSGAVVYLKDTRTMGVKSFITGNDGAYRFGQLASDTDYQVWAESSGKKSATKTVSSFDSKSQFVIDLKINAAK